MCILSYFPPETPADEQGLFYGGVSNPHGHGWAIVTGESILVGKSMDLERAITEFSAARTKHRRGPALFHSRWATHGSKGLANTHPFYVGGSSLTVVAHNGILPASAHPAKGDDRSDTRVFAEEIMPRQYRRLDREGVRRALSQWCSPANKLVILTADPRYQCSAYLVNQGAGEWDTETGVWHSNGDYRGHSRRGGGGCGGSFSGSGECEVCGFGTANDRGYCQVCRACQNCDEDEFDCLCWVFECEVCGFGVVDQHGYCQQCWACWECSQNIHDCQCWASAVTTSTPGRWS